ncbi:MAG: hypothetical protein ABIO70_16975 [Pseudomonadota bacterium]
MADPARATFFISTGRCATQWVHKTLEEAFPEEAVVTHEPILAAYNPKRFLRAGARLPELLQDPEVAAHVAMIKRTLDEGKHYVEAGWPCYPALPLLMAELGGRVNLVHLVRNPVFTAFSLATHVVYDRDDWIASGAITPDDPGVVQKELASTWKKLSMYEKCLFWWTEINLYGLELKREHPEIPYLLVRYEDLFAPGEPTALQAMVEHCGLPFTAELAAARAKTVDGFRQKAEPADWELIFRYPRTVSLARELGYPLDKAQAEVIEDRVSARYEVHGLRERVRGRWHGLKRRLGRVKRLLG